MKLKLSIWACLPFGGRVALAALIGAFIFADANGQIAGGMNDNTNVRMDGNNRIVGTVFWPSGMPVNTRVPIRLRTPANGDILSMTDDAGRFSFSGVGAGPYSLIIDTEPEFEPVREEVDIVRKRSVVPETYTLSIRLREKLVRRSKAEKPSVIDVSDAAAPKTAKKNYEKAAELARAGDHRGAIEKLKLAIDAYPKFISAFNELGVQYLRIGELKLAEATLRSALEIRPAAYEPLINLGIALFRQNRFEEAETIIREAIKANETAGVPRYYLGRTLNKIGRNDEAEVELLACLKIDAIGFKEAHRVLSVIYLARGDRARVVEELETYLRLNPLAPDAGDLRKVIEQNRYPLRSPSTNDKPVTQF